MRFFKRFFKLIKYVLIFIVIKSMIQQIDLSENNLKSIVEKIEHNISIAKPK